MITLQCMLIGTGLALGSADARPQSPPRDAAAVSPAPSAPGPSPKEQLALAKAAAAAGDSEAAAVMLIALWDDVLQTGAADGHGRCYQYNVELKKLIAKAPHIEAQVAALRDRAEAAMRARPTFMHCSGWIDLNSALNDADRTLVWFDEVKDSPEHAKTLRSLTTRLDDLFIARGRWSDLGYLRPDGLEALRSIEESWDAMRAGDFRHRELMDDSTRRRLQRDVGRLYAGLLASGRDDEAGQVAARACQIDRTGGMPKRLVQTALEADEPRPEHAQWLQTAYDKGEETAALAEDLRRALNGAPRAPREARRPVVPPEMPEPLLSGRPAPADPRDPAQPAKAPY